MSRFQSLKAVLAADPKRAAGEDLKDSQVERDVYRFIKKLNAIANLKDNDDIKGAMDEINKDQKGYLIEAFKLLKSDKEIALLMSQKSEDRIEQAWILARMLKEQFEEAAAKKKIEGSMTSLATYYKKA